MFTGNEQRRDSDTLAVGGPGQSRMVFFRIRAKLPSLRPSEQRTASYLLAEPLEAANMPIAELAVRVGTSTTSVLRCSQQLGYARFRDLRLDLIVEATRESLESSDNGAAAGAINRGDSLADIVAKVAHNEALSITDTAAALDINELKRAVDLVGAARRVDTFGVGAGALVGSDLQQKLSRIGRTALHWSDALSA